MTKDHERYREIELHGAGPAGTQARGDRLLVVLFRKQEKLRSHAVKHFTNLTETDTTWKALGGEVHTMVTQAIRELQDLGCPYFSQGLATPPCQGSTSRCRLFLSCGRIVAKMEDKYLELVENFLKESGQAPRYSYFFSDHEAAEIFCAMPDRPVVVKAVAWREGIYNLSTCYAGSGVSFTEMRDIQLDKIKNEARSRNIQLCSDVAWGVDQASEPLAPEGEAAAEAKKPGRPDRKPYKGGAQTWRKYLDDWETW
ncbi:MAG: hypothetical protein KKA60_15225 [Proteobacteria bacterium]|nr:hypothetical protein [Pseudomonadota bacterium]